MADDRSSSVPQDSARINLGDEREVRYWTEQLGVSEEQLQALVQQVGPSVSAIRTELASD